MGRLASQMERIVAAYRPTWFWDFKPGALHPSMSFSRASAGSIDAANGLVQSASSNVARFIYNPVTGAPLGVLPEPQSTNGVTRSQAMTGGGWAALLSTVTDNAVTSPDGTANASTLVENSSSGLHEAVNATANVTSGLSYGVSVYVKAGAGTRWFQLGFTPGTNAYVNFNPTTGLFGTNGAGALNAMAQQLANGWWRISFQAVATSTTTANLHLTIVPASTSVLGANYTGNSTAAYQVWGAQIDSAGVGVTSYILTAGAAATRAADVLTLPLSSLPGWDAAQGGVLVATYRLNSIAVSGNPQAIAQIDDGTNNNRYHLRAAQIASAVPLALMVASSSTQFFLSGGVTPTPLVRAKQAIGWSTARGILALNGSIAQSQSGAFTLPTGLTTLRIGGDLSGNMLLGPIETLAYYVGTRADYVDQQVTK